MICSQVLLSVFLAYWLYGQFNEQKNLLGNDIRRGLNTAEENVIDSLLASNIINPILSDSIFLSGELTDTTKASGPFAIELSVDSIPNTMIHILDKENGEHNKVIKSEFKLDNGSPNVGEELQSSVTIHAFSDSGNRMLFQGVKLLISSIEDFDDRQHSLYTLLASELDTTLLINQFQLFIDDKYGILDISWKPIEEHSSDEAMIFRSYLFTEPYGVEVKNYSFHLIASITTQIIFAVILLLITGAAFRMSYRNMKNQLKLNIIKSDFISNITHELKTPVSTVKVALEAILDYNQITDAARTREYLEMAHNEIDRLELLVNNVLNNTSIEEGKLFIVTEKTDLISLVENVLQSMQNQIISRNAEVEIESDNESVFAMVDKIHFYGVISNLLDNSLKYSSEAPQIKIKISRGKDSVNISVSDNGIGIPREYLSSVFDKFFRVPKGEKHNVKGYGLGLNYARLVLNQHGGEIVVRNNEVTGCCFTISIPDLK